MDLWAEFVQGSLVMALLLYIWQDGKSRAMQHAERTEKALAFKIDKEYVSELEARLRREIENAEDRQNREIANVRQDLNGIRRAVDTLQTEMNAQSNETRREMHDQFLKLFGMLK